MPDTYFSPRHADESRRAQASPGGSATIQTYDIADATVIQNSVGATFSGNEITMPGGSSAADPSSANALILEWDALDPAGTALATLTEMDNVKDVTLNLEAGEADVTTRANSGWRATAATLKEASVEFEMVWDTADAGFSAIKDAFFDGTNIDLAVMDGDIGQTGTQGLRAEFGITSFSRSEPLEEAITVSVTAKPAYSVNAPEWMVIP